MIKSLDIAARDLAEGQPVSETARDLMVRPMIHGWLYATIGQIRFRSQAKTYQVLDQIHACPYDS